LETRRNPLLGTLVETFRVLGVQVVAAGCPLLSHVSTNDARKQEQKRAAGASGFFHSRCAATTVEIPIFSISLLKEL